MDRMKVLNIQEIDALLDEGHLLAYDTIYGHVYMQDKEFNKLGAVRFDTFLKLTCQQSKTVKKTKGTYSTDMYERRLIK